jgi:hypothetical protein
VKSGQYCLISGIGGLGGIYRKSFVGLPSAKFFGHFMVIEFFNSHSPLHSFGPAGSFERIYGLP